MASVLRVWLMPGMLRRLASAEAIAIGSALDMRSA
jgi:hypothetical protein